MTDIQKPGRGRKKSVAPSIVPPEVIHIDGSQPYGPQAKLVRKALGLTLREVVERGGATALFNMSHWENCTGPYNYGGPNDPGLLYTYLRALGVGRVVISTELSAISKQ